MSIEYGMKDGAVLWIRNPFTGNVTYFNNIHRKPHAYRHLTKPQQAAPATPSRVPNYDLRADLRRVQDACVFCPGNEAMTMEEVMRVTYGDMQPGVAPPNGSRPDDWAIRVVRNIVPRIPEACTGGRNESYVIIEDARHFLPGAADLTDLMWSGALSTAQYYHVLRTTAEVVRQAMDNPAVKSVLIRKHQGQESGASQPHIHTQAIGADRIFPDVEQEMAVTARDPDVWQESVDLMRCFGFHLHESDGIVAQWSPFGKFGRHFEVIALDDRQPLHKIPDERLRLFARQLHRLLRALETAPHDLELHHGDGIPLHVHVNGRRYVYANFAGTLNAPADLATNYMPPTRQAMHDMARQTT